MDIKNLNFRYGIVMGEEKIGYKKKKNRLQVHVWGQKRSENKHQHIPPKHTSHLILCVKYQDFWTVASSFSLH